MRPPDLRKRETHRTGKITEPGVIIGFSRDGNALAMVRGEGDMPSHGGWVWERGKGRGYILGE